MNAKLLCSMCLLALVPLHLQADGIPYDRVKGRMTEPCLVLRLSDAQDKQANSERKLTLTERQYRSLSKKCPEFPRTIPEVFSYRYSDCTCLTGYPYVVLLPGGHEAALTKDQLAGVKKYGVRDRSALFQPPWAKPSPPKRPWLARCWSWLKGGD